MRLTPTYATESPRSVGRTSCTGRGPAATGTRAKSRLGGDDLAGESRRRRAQRSPGGLEPFGDAPLGGLEHVAEGGEVAVDPLRPVDDVDLGGGGGLQARRLGDHHGSPGGGIDHLGGEVVDDVGAGHWVARHPSGQPAGEGGRGGHSTLCSGSERPEEVLDGGHDHHDGGESEERGDQVPIGPVDVLLFRVPCGSQCGHSLAGALQPWSLVASLRPGWWQRCPRRLCRSSPFAGPGPGPTRIGTRRAPNGSGESTN